ncbi:MAG: hypothetical protein Q4D85_06345 [Corynebacterium sp.]|uniref:hypothetical protein n=1 Tax=Corynebacterium sp. TaxID=1720 RepID=UPI0026DBBB98|nr:hypothetical protein [Corynebacterium sp.]MDO5098364.1 hypothetical protein [Corynebacterium sp.]
MNPDSTTIRTLIGWESITASEAATAPLGEAEQQQQAKALLEKLTEPDLTLGILAIRLGVRPTKAVELLPPNPPKVVTRALVERGEKYVRGFIAAACRPQFRMRTHELSDFGERAVMAVAELSCSPPDNVEFFRDWSILVARNPSLLPGAVFREYFSQAVALGVPALGALCMLPKIAVDHGWLTRDEACVLVWSGLGSATRPGDRKAWIKALTSDLGVSATELSVHADQVASLPAGENAVVAHLIVPLLRQKSVAERSTLVLNGLYASSKKQIKAVLDGIADECVPDAVARVQELAADSDSGVAACAQRVLERWGVAASTPEPSPTCPDGVWQPTPPVWEVPRFDVSAMTLEDLRHDWAVVYGGNHARSFSLEAERVLCFTHRLAKSDKQALRQVLSGTADQLWPYNLVSWAQDDPPQREEFTAFTLCNRNDSITGVLGDLPVLLSEPTWEDFRIHPGDLLDRLRRYEAEQATIFSPDFFQALLRVDVSVVSPDKLLQLIDAATTLTLTVTVAEDCVVSAGRIVAEYFQNPVADNPSDLKPDVFNNLIPLSSPAFDDVVAYFGQELRCKPLPFYLPTFGDGVFRSLVWRNGKNPMMVAMAIECSRRAQPLSPRVAMNLLAVQRATAPEAAQLLHKAVTDAWRRGLLIPGVADVGQLDWGAELSQIPPLVSALRGLADDGLLAVVWDVLDQLLGRAALAEVLSRGLIDVVDAIDYFLPTTPDSARSLPGLHALAARKGKAKVLTRAREVVEKLRRATSPG